MKQCKEPEHWWTGLIVPIWKRKGDAQDPGKYRGITLLSADSYYEITREDSGQEVA